jgi:hypothetical protein
MRNFTKENLHKIFKTRSESGIPVGKINPFSKILIKSHQKLLLYILKSALSLSCQFILILPAKSILAYCVSYVIGNWKSIVLTTLWLFTLIFTLRHFFSVAYLSCPFK